MRIIITLLIFVFISFFSCDKSEAPTTEVPIIKEPVTEDEKKPELSVDGFTDIIESYTEVTINIVDESSVETKVTNNGEELAFSTEKQISLLINPYVLPIGPTDFTVSSKDINGNETSKKYSVEIKHLLMTYEYGSQESEVGPQRWVFFNALSEGQELATIAPTVGETKIYTDDIILEDKILYTVADFYKFNSPYSNFDNLNVITYKIPLGTKRFQGYHNNFEEYLNTVTVTLNDVPLVNNSPDYYAFGKGGYVSAYSGDEQQTILTIKHNASGPICIRTNRSGGSAPKFDGKKENYRHFIFTPEEGETSIVVEAGQLVPADETMRLDIPEQDPGTLFINRYGYRTLEEFDQYLNSSIYEKDSDNETQIVDYVDLPILPTYGFYTNYLSYRKNGHYYSTQASDDDLDVNMPNWPASVQVTDSHIQVSSDNQEVDYYSVRLDKTEFVGNDGKTLNWLFNVFEEDGLDKSIPRLALPEMISDYIGDSYYQTTSDLELNLLSAFDYYHWSSYDEVADAHVFNKNRLNGSEGGYRQLIYPISDDSGKSKRPNSSIIDEFHRYHPDGRGKVINHLFLDQYR